MSRAETLPIVQSAAWTRDAEAALSSAMQSRLRWLSPLLFAVTLGLTAIGGGGIARLLFPCGAALVALVLYRRAPATYISFVWWLWFLSPFVRRFVDYRAGFAEPNPVLLAPFLATLVCSATMLKSGTVWRERTTVPFLLAFAAVVYGLLIGLLHLPINAVLSSAMNWLTPLFFGFHLYRLLSEDPQASDYIRAIKRTFCLGVLVMGAYGIAQFVLAPGWDQFWMRQITMNSIGTPEPFGIRVFSTMNAPGPFAAVLAAGLLLLLAENGLIAIVASLAGYASLILSQARSAWLIWAIAAVILLLQRRTYIRRVALALVLVGTSVLLLMSNSTISDVVGTRFTSITNLDDDVSYQERQNGYERMTAVAEKEFLGRGLGVMDVEFNNEVGGLGPHDSGFWEIALSLGWIGGAAYLLSLFLIVALLLKKSADQPVYQVAIRSVVFAILSQFVLGSFMLGVSGVVLWGFAGMALSRTRTASATLAPA